MAALSVCKIGTNDADYSVVRREGANRIWCPYYRVWSNMLLRCGDNFQRRNPTYIGCKVCDEWKSFMFFRSWMMAQDWEDKQLDKDLIGSGKFYSPDMCCFIPGWLNTLFGKRRGKYPAGIHWDRLRNKFQVQVKFQGKRIVSKRADSLQQALEIRDANRLEAILQ